jgi:cyclophilin family peptidyl-prolyl cis-trans isomerase
MRWILIVLFRAVGALGNQQVRCETTAADFTIELHREWAPLGVDRFVELVEAGFFDDQIIYRVVPGHAAHFGVAPDPDVQAKWQQATIQDDPQLKIPFSKGTVSFLGNTPLPNSRSTHILISDEPHGTSMGSAPHERPIGRITDATDRDNFFKNCHSGYGDTNHLKKRLATKGNEALTEFPELSRIDTCYLVELGRTKSSTASNTGSDTGIAAAGSSEKGSSLKGKEPHSSTCEVCVDVLNRVGRLLTSSNRREQGQVEEAIRTFCRKGTQREQELAAQQEKMVRIVLAIALSDTSIITLIRDTLLLTVLLL